jgi:fucose permease
MAVTLAALASLALASWVHTVIGARRGILAALAVAAAGIATVGVGAGVAGSLPLTVAGLVGIGLGIGLLDVLINVEGAALEAAVGRSLMPFLHASWSAGAILGAGIGAAGAALAVRVQWQFGAEALAIAAAAVWVAASIPDHPDPSGPGDDREGAPHDGKMSPVARLRRWAGGWTNTRLLLIGLVMLGAELGEGSANTWLTLASQEAHGYQEGASAGFFVVFAAAETLARAAGSPLVDRFGRTAVVRATSAAGVLGVVLFVLGDSAWSITAGVVLWALGVSMGFPLGMSAAAEAGPRAAQQVSVVAAIGYAANLAGPPILGTIADVVGLLRALWVVVALLAVASLLAPAVGDTRPSARRDGTRAPG